MTHKHAPASPGQALLDAFLRKPSGTPLVAVPARGKPLAPAPVPPAPAHPRSNPVVVHPPATGRRPHRRAWSRDDIAQVRALVAAGHSNASIGERFGRTAGAVAALLHVEGIRRTPDVLSDIRCGVRPA